MALGVEVGEGRGRGGGFACLAHCQLTAQLDIVEHSERPCLAACHFGIVSAIESLFNLSLSLQRHWTDHPFSYLIRGHTGYFSDRAEAATQSLMNSLIQEEFSDRFFSLN